MKMSIREKIMALPRVWAKLSRDYYDDAAPFIELVGEDKKDDILVMCEELIRASDVEALLDEPMVDAAPDMYKALKDVIDDLERRAAMEGPDEPVAIGQSRYINAVAALAKAEGKQ